MIDLRYEAGQSWVPRIGPHTNHDLVATGVKPVTPEHDRVSVACRTCHGYFHFVDHWGRFA